MMLGLLHLILTLGRSLNFCFSRDSWILFEKNMGALFILNESIQICIRCEFYFQNISGKNIQGYMRMWKRHLSVNFVMKQILKWL